MSNRDAIIASAHAEARAIVETADFRRRLPSVTIDPKNDDTLIEALEKVAALPAEPSKGVLDTNIVQRAQQALDDMKRGLAVDTLAYNRAMSLLNMMSSPE